jgi:hypothetical protein
MDIHVTSNLELHCMFEDMVESLEDPNYGQLLSTSASAFNISTTICMDLGHQGHVDIRQTVVCY